MYDKDFSPDIVSCKCCYMCIKRHANEGCLDCSAFLTKYLPVLPISKFNKSVMSELKSALTELFVAMECSSIKVEEELEISCPSFVKDVIKIVDEIKSAADIEKVWHINREVALNVFSVIQEVLYGNDIGDILSSDEDMGDESEDEEDMSSTELEHEVASSDDDSD